MESTGWPLTCFLFSSADVLLMLQFLVRDRKIKSQKQYSTISMGKKKKRARFTFKSFFFNELNKQNFWEVSGSWQPWKYVREGGKLVFGEGGGGVAQIVLT